MPGSDDKVEEWQRIRDRQLAARDPDTARSKRTQRVQQRHKNAHQSMSLKEILQALSWKVVGGIIGIVLGLIVWAIMSRLLTGPWVNWGALIVGVLLTALGVLFGASFDWRDDLRDF